ncbi:MAG: DUF2752 domain-containing protein [Chthoniobacterales bacterium]|nr:DUF2752 domain-containing protein [Chthoniobacterales bacterium]
MISAAALGTPPPLPRRIRTRVEQNMVIVGIAAAVLGVSWCAVVMAVPSFHVCTWKTLTGFPCAGCGGTRALLLLFGGRWSDALLMNPGAVLSAVVWAVLMLYASSVLIFRLEPWRPAWRGVRMWRWVFAGAVAVNWLYLLAVGRV